MEDPREQEKEERLRLAFKIISRQIKTTNENYRHLRHRQRRVEKLILKALRDFKKFFTVNQN